MKTLLMYKSFIFTLFAFVMLSMVACDNYETYAEQRDKAYASIDRYIAKNKINVISEAEFLKDTTTDVSKNEYVLFPSSGIYMQIVNRGCGEMLKDGESTSVLVRFKEYNLVGDSLQLSNMIYYYDWLVDKFDVTNKSGSFYGSFQDGQSLLARQYQSNSVPAGWLFPLSYIRLGRLVNEGDEKARVKIIVPHDLGHQYASQGVYPCFYEMTFQRGK